jgi:outer membrane protein TolC
MQKIRNISILLVLTILSSTAFAQLNLTLEDIVKISRTENISARKALVQKKNASWDFKLHKAGLKPQLQLKANPLDFNRGITPVLQDDGSYALMKVNQNAATTSLALSQPIPGLGADVYMSGSAYRFDNLNSGVHSYSFQPVELGISMPLFKYKSLKWDKRIKPVQYEEALKSYNRSIEISAYTGVQLYFRSVMNYRNWELASTNYEMNKKLFYIASEKFKKGQISKDELLQVQLMKINAWKALNASQVERMNSDLQLLTHLSVETEDSLSLTVPAMIPEFFIEKSKALEYAIHNNPESTSYKRRLLEAEDLVAQAKGQTGISGDFYASIGYSGDLNQSNQLALKEQAIVQMGITLPILDWGRSKALRTKAKISKELVETEVEQERYEFKRELYSLVNIVNMLRNNLKDVEVAMDLSQERYTIAYKRYLAGDITVMELNIAQSAKDRTNQEYLQSLSEFWIQYYRLRMLCLYDFISEKQLVKS